LETERIVLLSIAQQHIPIPVGDAPNLSENHNALSQFGDLRSARDTTACPRISAVAARPLLRLSE